MRLGRIAALSLITATALITAAAIPLASRKLGPYQKIDRWGYQIRVPDRWVSIPAQPDETKVVGTWQPDMDDIEKKYDVASLNCELLILRFPIKAAATGAREGEKPKGGESGDKGKPEDEARERLLKLVMNARYARTLDEWIEATFPGAAKRYAPQEVVAGKGSTKLTGRLLEFTSGASYVCAGVFNKDLYDWGVFYQAPEGYYEKEWKAPFLESIKSFRLFDPKGEPTTAMSVTDPSKLTRDERREAIKAGIAGNPGWWALDTDNYVFLTNSADKRFIADLGKEIETLRAKVYEDMFPPSGELDTLNTVRVFSDQSEYHQYGGPYGSAGYWDSAREELVLFENFDDMSKTKSKTYTKAVMYHEAFHQYIHYAIGDLAPHSWFNEGHGDYFAGHVIRGTTARAEVFSWRVGYLKDHLRSGKGLIPTRSLVRLPQSEYYSNAGLKYAQGWALVYFLREVTREKRWQEIPDRYFKHLRDNIAAFKKSKKDTDDASGESIPGIPGVKVYSFEDEEKVRKILEEAVDHGFEGVDFEELDRQFLKWVESIT